MNKNKVKYLFKLGNSDEILYTYNDYTVWKDKYFTLKNVYSYNTNKRYSQIMDKKERIHFLPLSDLELL